MSAATCHAAPAAALQRCTGRTASATVSAAWRPTPFAAPQRRSSGSSSGGAARRAARRGAQPVQALLGGLTNVFKNDPAERTRKQYQSRVDEINALEPSMQQLTDEQLRELTTALKARAAKGEPLDSLLVEAFAVSRGRCRSAWRWPRRVSGRDAVTPQLACSHPSRTGRARVVCRQACIQCCSPTVSAGERQSSNPAEALLPPGIRRCCPKPTAQRARRGMRHRRPPRCSDRPSPLLPPLRAAGARGLQARAGPAPL